MSQVKNLRAMFESKGDTSPPDRGRSGASTPVPGFTGSDSPRPLSKVRTNFVAIEKDGRIGLRRDESHESSASRRRLSMETDAESTTSAPDKSTVSSDEVTAKLSRLTLQETIPESPRQPPEKITIDSSVVSGKPDNTQDAKSDQGQPEALAPAETAPKSHTKGPKLSTVINGKAKAEKPKEVASKAHAKTTGVKKTSSRPATISTKPTTAAPAAKSPAKPSAGTTTRAGPSAVARAQDKPAVKKQPATSRPGSSLTRPTASSATKKPQPLKPLANDTVFVKPKPKSPTKPVHLPASLTAHTASSVSKSGKGGTNNLSVPARSPSRASVSTTSSATGKTIRRQPSSINSQRPSLGPPPKKLNSDASAKRDAPVDEGFLARMMRPTQSSSSKTSEKAPVTPPRKTAKRPSLPGDSRPENIRAPGSAKKSVRRQADSCAHSQSATSKEPSPSPAPEHPVTPEPESASESLVEEPVEETAQETIETVPEEVIAVRVPTKEAPQKVEKADTTESTEHVREEDVVEFEPAPEGSTAEVAQGEPIPEDHVEVAQSEVKVAEQLDAPEDKATGIGSAETQLEATEETGEIEEIPAVEDEPCDEQAAPAGTREPLEEPTEGPAQETANGLADETKAKAEVEYLEKSPAPFPEEKKELDVEEPKIEEQQKSEDKDEEKNDSATQ